MLLRFSPCILRIKQFNAKLLVQLNIFIHSSSIHPHIYTFVLHHSEMFIESIPGSVLGIVDIMQDRLNFVFLVCTTHFMTKTTKRRQPKCKELLCHNRQHSTWKTSLTAYTYSYVLKGYTRDNAVSFVFN